MGVSSSAYHIKPSSIRSRGSRIQSAVTVRLVRATPRKGMFESFFTLKSHKWEESNPSTSTSTSTSTSHNKGAAFPLGSKEPSIHAEDRMKHESTTNVQRIKITPVPSSTKAKKRSKTALVLAGGGVTGVVYEVGVLQALTHFLTGEFTLNDFDMVMGLSAGSLVGSLLVNGITPAEMMGAMGEHPSTTLSKFSKWDVFRPNFSEFFERAMGLPFTLTQNLWRNISNYTLGKNPYAELLDEILPSAIFTNSKVADFVRNNLQNLGRTNDFRELVKKFYVIATELDTGDRVIFGDEGYDHIPISKAVQASTAIPLFYRPVRIGRRDYVDGAMRKTLHIDIAIEKGAELIICINPVVPLRNDTDKKSIPMFGHKGRYISDKGFQHVWRQMLRLMLHSRIPAGLERYRRFYPNVDIILIEPREDDYKMFFHNIMDYDARVSVAEHGYKTMIARLSEHFEEYAAIFARHGIDIHPPRKSAHHATPRSFDNTPPALRRVRIAQANHRELNRLHSVLQKLDSRLDSLAEESAKPPIHPEGEFKSRVANV